MEVSFVWRNPCRRRPTREVCVRVYRSRLVAGDLWPRWGVGQSSATGSLATPGVGRRTASLDPCPYLVGEPAGLAGTGEWFEDLPRPAAAVKSSGRDE